MTPLPGNWQHDPFNLHCAKAVVCIAVRPRGRVGRCIGLWGLVVTTWAAPGVKCVCVREGHLGPKLNDVCTIDEVKADASGVWLVLVEYGWRHTDTATTVERRRPWFRVDRFRPLITRTQEQDLALFTPILDGLRIGEPA